MSVLAEQKSQLAKLMATENLTVQHSKIPTAAFDTKNRVLYLPIWKDMNGVMYDLLGGHEVGHALYTPNEGWHNAVSDKGKNYKGFLNVIEDARIEKKIKRKYPGLRNSFVKAYQTLIEQDFFGIKDRDINKMPFIDRLNIYTKSQYTADHIQFSDIEKNMLQKVVDLETWDDVLRLTEEIYQYSKDEQQQIQDQHQDFNYGDNELMGDPDEYDFSDDYDDADSEQDSADSDDSDDSDGSGDESEESETTDGDGEESDGESDGEESDEETEVSSLNRQKESKSSDEDQYDPTCLTDEIYRQREMQLVDEQCKPYVYIDIPKPKLNRIVTPAKRVQEILTDFYNTKISDKSEIMTAVKEFKSKNEKYVSLLAKEFEMRKAAKAYSKSKVSETGDLDLSKLASYRFNDNIFRKVTFVPKGKSHGMMLLLDRSGSMSGNMAGSIEQILVLVMFCRKVNIPFAVYGFGDADEGRKFDFPLESKETEEQNSKNRYLQKTNFETNLNSLFLSSVYLREYLNSKMSSADYNRAFANMVLLKLSYEHRSRWYDGRFGRPEAEQLSNTPLTQAIVALAPIMREFRKSNNLDITNLVIVHDGDADDTNSYTLENCEYTVTRPIQTYNCVNILRDKENKFETKLAYERDNNRQVYKSVMNWFRKTTQSKIFGFYLSGGSSFRSIVSNQYYTEDGNPLWMKRKENESEYQETLSKLTKQMREQKFVSNKSAVFDEFYFIANGTDLQTEDEKLEVDGKVTAGKLKNAFMKFNKKKTVNRILVSKFIQNVAV